MPNLMNAHSHESRPVTRRSFLQGTGAALLAGGSGAALASCGGGVSSPAGSGQGKKTASGTNKVTFLNIIPLESISFSQELLADAGGYFSDQGLDVRFQTTQGSAQAIQLVLSGSAPITRIAQIEAMEHAANKGAPLLNVGTLYREQTIRWVSSARDPLKRPKDFVGKTIGIPSEGGSSETTLKLFLAVNGIDPERVNRQVVGLSPGVFNLVKKGRIAGYAVSTDTAKILQQQRSGVVAVRPGQFMTAGTQFYMVSQDRLSQNRDTIAKYMQAIHAAMDFISNDDGFDKTLKIIRKKYSFDTLQNTKIAKASLRASVQAWGSSDKLLWTDPQNWQKAYQELVQTGVADGGKDPKDWFTNELVPKG